MCSSLVHVGYIVYPFNSNVIDVSNKTYLGLADQMHTCIKTSGCVRFLTCSEGKMMYII